jgi:hypothetical protein
MFKVIPLTRNSPSLQVIPLKVIPHTRNSPSSQVIPLKVIDQIPIKFTVYTPYTYGSGQPYPFSNEHLLSVVCAYVQGGGPGNCTWYAGSYTLFNTQVEMDDFLVNTPLLCNIADIIIGKHW